MIGIALGPATWMIWCCYLLDFLCRKLPDAFDSTYIAAESFTLMLSFKVFFSEPSADHSSGTVILSCGLMVRISILVQPDNISPNITSTREISTEKAKHVKTRAKTAALDTLTFS